MNDTLTIIFATIMVIITIILSVVGVQMMFVLRELKKTLTKINTTLDQAEMKINSIVSPLQNLGGMAAGLQTGLKVFESFVSWLNKKKHEKSE